VRTHSHQQFAVYVRSVRLLYHLDQQLTVSFHVFPVHGTQKASKLRIASFVHGSDGLGNQDFPAPTTKQVDQTAAAFLVEQANLYPGQVTVVALGPLTNLALAIELDPSFPKKIGQIIILGGAYSVNGNVNPAAEANIFGDPDAADIVFTCGADILAIGLNVTHQVVLTDADREKLEQCDSKYARYLCKIMGIYFDYHKDAYFIKGVYLHDPTTLIAAVNPSLMTYTEGVVRVQTVGITKGLTVFDNTKKRLAKYMKENAHDSSVPGCVPNPSVHL
jgi:inosine-uridine nucleoside N-ribohydrolase